MDIEKLPLRQAVEFILINDDNKILIVQSTHYAYKEWKLPSGGIDEGETYEDAVRREIQEELGLFDYKIKGFLEKSSSHPWSKKVIEKYGYKYKGQQVSSFLVKVSNDVKFSLQEDEIREVKWVDKEDLEKYLLFEGQLENALKTLEKLGV